MSRNEARQRPGRKGGPSWTHRPHPHPCCQGLLLALCWAQGGTEWAQLPSTPVVGHFTEEESVDQAGRSLARAQSWSSLNLRPLQCPRPIQTPKAPSSPSLPEACLASPSQGGSLYMPRPLLGPVSQEAGRVSGGGDKRPGWQTSTREQLYVPSPPPPNDL